jgi:hypothetical protein
MKRLSKGVRQQTRARAAPRNFVNPRRDKACSATKKSRPSICMLLLPLSAVQGFVFQVYCQEGKLRPLRLRPAPLPHA